MRRLAVMMATVLFLGCGGASDAPQLAKVSGTVTMGGNPVVDATVTFHLDGEGAPRPGMGKTDASGNFRITTFNNNDGAIVGTHIVTVAKIEANPAESSGDMDMEGEAYGAAMNAAASETEDRKQVFPEEYATKATSPLKITVPAGGNDDVQLDLE